MTSPTPQQVVLRQAEARSAAKLYRIAVVEQRESFIFARRLEYNVRADAWLDLKTGERGNLKCPITELLRKFFPQVEQAQIGGAR